MTVAGDGVLGPPGEEYGGWSEKLTGRLQLYVDAFAAGRHPNPATELMLADPSGVVLYGCVIEARDVGELSNGLSSAATFSFWTPFRPPRSGAVPVWFGRVIGHAEDLQVLVHAPEGGRPEHGRPEHVRPESSARVARRRTWRQLVGAERAEFARGLHEQYREGRTVRELAETHGRSFGLIQRLLVEDGAVLRPRGGRERRRTLGGSVPAGRSATASEGASDVLVPEHDRVAAEAEQEPGH